MSDPLPNVLASRYASPQMCTIWSPEGRTVLERELWIAVLRAQKDLGIEVPDGAIDAYEAVKGQVDLESIRQREIVTRHDVKAKIEEFCELAGHEQIHKGMTSRDLTENVEGLQVHRSLVEVRRKAAAALAILAEKAGEFRDLPLTARTHNVAAQLTTFGRRMAMFGDEFHAGFRALNSLVEEFPVRGIRGAVGTSLDQLTLFDGDAEKASELDSKVRQHLGVKGTWDAPGQVYPRSLDFRTVSVLCDLSSAPCSFAKTLRIMAGTETAGEGFAKGQVGSSAMPHKMNSRSCERINGFGAILRGHLTMVGALAGDQWNEGDVSCSVVRRVALPDAFFAIDGLLETFLTVLGQMEVSEGALAAEAERYLPFLTTTTVMMEAVKAGAGREEAHEAIKEHAVAVAKALRSGELKDNDLPARLAADSRLGMTEDQIGAGLADGCSKVGLASKQIDQFQAAVAATLEPFAEEAAYRPGEIL